MPTKRRRATRRWREPSLRLEYVDWLLEGHPRHPDDGDPLRHESVYGTFVEFDEPPPDLAALSTGVAPRTAREATLARLVAEVLGLPAVGIEDRFFDLGGDSIGAIGGATGVASSLWMVVCKARD